MVVVTPGRAMDGREFPPVSGRLRRGFTLVELLVVITVLVILLALLLPSLEEGVYQAKLARCAANLRGVGSAAMAYAGDHQAHFPWLDARVDCEPHRLSSSAWDLRPLLRPFLPINKSINCPFTDQPDFDAQPPNATIYASTSMWFGFEYQAEQGLRRVSDRWTFGGLSFGLLAADYDCILTSGADANNPLYLGSHPDSKGRAVLLTKSEPTDDQTSVWVLGGSYMRAPLDLNFGYVDGSVSQVVDATYNDYDRPDTRMVRVPRWTWQGPLSNVSIQWYNVPRP